MDMIPFVPVDHIINSYNAKGVLRFTYLFIYVCSFHLRERDGEEAERALPSVY